MASALRVRVSPSAYLYEHLDSLTSAEFQESSFAVVILSNGPGELATWVKPVAEELHKKLVMRPRGGESEISLRLVLVPCPNATGNEMEAAKKFNQFDKITAAKSFWKILINPHKYGFWPKKGLVIFLGGDQFWSVLLSARLGYKHLTYAEWVARWPRWNNKIAAMTLGVKKRINKKYRDRCTVVGDLMADLPDIAKNESPLPDGKWIALLPGSKKAKLSIGVPFFLEVADKLSKIDSKYKFLLPLAPTTSIEEIEYFSSKKNPIALKYKSGIKTILPSNNINLRKKIITTAGTEIELEENVPAHSVLIQCNLALTTVGANTAELGALGVPMIVIIPTQHLDVMEAWDGFLGVLARLPVFRWFLGVLITAWRLRNQKYLAWPNISAKRMIVPEKMGKITTKEIAYEAYSWISSPKRLNGQKEDLRNLRGKPGAVNALTEEIIEIINLIKNKGN